MSKSAVLAQISGLLSNRDWRMNNIYHIQDKQGLVIPFRMNESQEQFYREMWWLNIILKDRQRGFSTEIALFILDSCLFHANTQAGVIDITLPDAKKKLDKMRFAYGLLPEPLRTAIPLVTDAKETLEWANGSRVDVSTSHRGGTLQILHVSEYGKISARKPDVAREIKTGSFNTVAPESFIFIESTAEGREGNFHDMCAEAQRQQQAGSSLTPMDFKFHFYGWWMGTENELDDAGVVVPQKLNEYLDGVELEIGQKITARKRAWYARKVAQQGDDMKREFPSTPGEAFEQAIDGSYYSRQMAKMRAEGRITKVPYEEGFPVYTWWDLGMDDSTTIIFRQQIGMQNRIIDYYEASGEGLAHYARILKEKGYLYECHYMPHDARVRELGTGISRVDKARELGIHPIHVIERARDIDAVLDGIEAVRNLLSTCWIDESKCADLIKCLDGYRKEWDDRAGAFRRSPSHNWACHGADAARTGGIAVRQESAGDKQGIKHDAKRDWFF